MVEGEVGTLVVLAPAIIAGTVGLLSAALSAAVAITSMRKQGDLQRDKWRQDLLLTVLSQQLRAIESAWLDVFQYERSGRLRRPIDEAVTAAIWMSPELQAEYVGLLAQEQPESSDFAKVRELLRAEIDSLYQGDPKPLAVRGGR